MKRRTNGLLIFFATLGIARGAHAATVADKFQPLPPFKIKIEGMLGQRCAINENKRLLTKNESELLGGFQQRPGKQAWIGEHVGKWLHAATLAWAYTGDPALKQKLDRVATQLMDTQLSDGYLGTYTEEKRWSKEKNYDWDVWVHKYDLIGLLTYAQYMQSSRAIEVSRKIADLLIVTFGPGGKLDINDRSTHVGMASGSVLEPIMMLYNMTREPRYLQFAQFLVEHWEESKGPKILSTLTTVGSVKKTANAKAYEMLSCLVGVCELYRTTGEPKYLTAATNAWKDIVENQLMISGSGSSREHWTESHMLPNDPKSNIAETCVTVTWMQLNQQLLRLAGEAKYADELERTVYNHLAAAQKYTGDAWSYYTPLEGTKPFKPEQNCCTSSGPRGWAMLPSFVYMTAPDGAVVNFFTPSRASLEIGERTVEITQRTDYPQSGAVTLQVKASKPGEFTLYIRVPAWSKVKGLGRAAGRGDYYALRKQWKSEETVRFTLEVPTRIVRGIGSNQGKLAVMRGPVVMAVDEKYNPKSGAPDAIALEGRRSSVLLRPIANLKDTDSAPVYEIQGWRIAESGAQKSAQPIKVRLNTFATAGGDGTRFKVWLPEYDAAGRR